MRPIEYLRKKNELVKRITGKILIPEDQLVEHEFNENFIPSKGLFAINCTYCNIRRNESGCIDCADCPMHKAGNGCHEKDSTYRQAEKIWSINATDKDKEELYNLGKDYYESNMLARETRKR